MQRQSVRYRRLLGEGNHKGPHCAPALLCQLVIERRRWRLAYYAGKTAGRASQGHARDLHSGACCRVDNCSRTQQGQNKQQCTIQGGGTPGEQQRGRSTFASLSTALQRWTHSVAMLQCPDHTMEEPQVTCTTQNRSTLL